jgi:hypothetical protein
MHRNFKLFAAFFALLLSMCTIYDQSGAIIAPNGLSCQNFTNYESFEGQPAAECYYSCPDGTGRQVEIEEEFSSASPLYKASKEELNERFCEDPNLPVLTEPAGPDSLRPGAESTSTEEASPTPTATRRPTLTPWRKPYLTVTLTERPRDTSVPPTRTRQPQPTNPPPQPTNPPPEPTKTDPPNTPEPPQDTPVPPDTPVSQSEATNEPEATPQ